MLDVCSVKISGLACCTLQEWGSSCYSPVGLAYVGEAMTQLATQHNHFPPYSSFPGVEQLSGKCVRDCLKLNFREYQGVTDPAQQMDLINGVSGEPGRKAWGCSGFGDKPAKMCRRQLL